jgi:RNA polymerase sigma-B factor
VTATLPLSAGNEATLHCRYAASHDPLLRERLVCRYLPLARYAASQYAQRSEPFDDLVQIAAVGLLKALERFDPARGTAFASFALPTMSGELRRHFRDHAWLVRPPRGLQELVLRTEGALERLTARLGRSPTTTELSEELGLDEEEVLEALEAAGARTGVSLSTPARGRGEEDGTLQDRIGRDDDALVTAEQRAMLASLWDTLTVREREIVLLRFAEDLTQSAIGRRMGLSQMHVSRVIRQALDKLRRAAEAQPACDAQPLEDAARRTTGHARQ